MSTTALSYNFVFFFAREDYWTALLGQELKENDCVHIYNETFDGPAWMRKLFHYHWAYRINRYFDIPFKRIWFRKMYRQRFKYDLPLCFVYLGGNTIYRDGGFTEYVRRMDPRNRQVIMHQDLISKKIDYDYSIIRNKVDLATTYDLGEAEKYGIHYFRENTYSKLIPLPEQFEFESDVYFLGAVKDRLGEIMEIYHKLSESGLKCLFILAGVEDKDRVEADGIEYTNGISYNENLQHVVRTKCMLEVAQGGSQDNTARMNEALAYQRRLITNCRNTPVTYFHERQLLLFSSLEEIDPAFVKREYEPALYPPIVDLNPMRRLYDIQEQLEQQEYE